MLPKISDFALSSNLKTMQNSLRHLPEGAYQDYCYWLMEQPLYGDEWYQLIGLHGLVRMTNALMENLLEDDEMEKTIPFSTVINIQQVYEVVSDNIAIGLARQRPGDDTFALRRDILLAFNAAMIARLQDVTYEPATTQLASHVNQMESVSAFEQSLNFAQHSRLMEAFCAENQDVPAELLEFSLFPALVGNIETCIDLADHSRAFKAFELIRDGLVWRYAAVSRLLSEESLTFDELIEASTDAIMVIPTLAYYGAVLAEAVRPLSGYQAAYEDGTLLSVYKKASLLVRLLNDMGTAVLEQSDDDHEALIARLRQIQQQEGLTSLHDVLMQGIEAYQLPMTRLHKDLSFGEFNIALYHTLRIEEVDAALYAFDVRVQTIRELYRQTWAEFKQEVAALNKRLNDPLVGNMAAVFVQFHQALYAANFKDPMGEYAV